jgi:hypothetical protein
VSFLRRDDQGGGEGLPLLRPGAGRGVKRGGLGGGRRHMPPGSKAAPPEPLAERTRCGGSGRRPLSCSRW